MSPNEVPPILDKHGRPIEPLDVLKCFHFRGGPRNKNYFMYKQVFRNPEGYLYCTHLDGTDSWFDARVLRGSDFEIIQSKNHDKLD
jgi:hypothetical protein